MTASTIHEGSNAFMRRALHFATREISRQPRIVPLPATWLSYYILYRSGMTVDAIAVLVDVGRKHIARRIAAAMALMGHAAISERVEALVSEMGSINFEDRGGTVVRFPGPPKLAPRQTVEAAL